MKILITGGYGFIGSHIADKFYKEGHSIYIIDNLLSGNQENVKIPHNFYNIDVNDAKCEDIFKANNFDVVIHMAAQADGSVSVNHPVEETKTNLLGLINMLHLSSKYRIRKFIFPSSAEVYGNNENMPFNEYERTDPISPLGIDKLMGEYYCHKWHENYGLNTLCFRISNVYGPRQGAYGQDGVVSAFIRRALSKSDINIYGNGLQTRDFIYVKDVTNAIYKGVFVDNSTVFNLSTNQQHSIEELLQYIMIWHEAKQIQYKETRPHDIKHSCLDNTKTKRALDWVPLFDLNEGIIRTIKWYQDKPLKSPVKEKVKRFSPIRLRLKKVLPTIENISVFFMLIVISNLFNTVFTNNIGTFLISYIVFIGLSCGIFQSLFATFLSCALYLYTQSVMGKDFLSIMCLQSNQFQVLLIIAVGVFIGFLSEDAKWKLTHQKGKYDELKEENSFYKKMFDDVIKQKQLLETQIVSYDKSLVKVSNCMEQLDETEPEKLYYKTLKVAKELLLTDQMAIYLVDKNSKYLRVIAQSGIENEKKKNTIVIQKGSPYQFVIDHAELYINSDFEADCPPLIAPIMVGKQVKGIITFYDIPFDNLHLFEKNTILTFCNLVSHFLSQSYEYLKYVEQKRYIEGTGIIKNEYFNDILRFKQELQKKGEADYSLLLVHDENSSRQKLSAMLLKEIRDIDYIGENQGKLMVLLTGTSNQEAGNVIRRLSSEGISCELA